MPTNMEGDLPPQWPSLDMTASTRILKCSMCGGKGIGLSLFTDGQSKARAQARVPLPT